MIEAVALAVVALAVATGAVLQRITGIGFGSVSGPALILVWGPVVGVQTANLLSAICSLALLAILWRQVEIRRTLVLTGGAVAAAPLGVAVAAAVPAGALQIGIGVVMLTALFAVGVIARWRFMSTWGGALATGLVGGAATAAVGQVGPLVGAYALASRWEFGAYVASMQVCWVIVNSVAVAFKGLPPLPPTTLATFVGALLVGVVFGALIGRRLSRAAAERALFVIALLGSLLVLGKGVLAVWGA